MTEAEWEAIPVEERQAAFNSAEHATLSAALAIHPEWAEWSEEDLARELDWSPVHVRRARRRLEAIRKSAHDPARRRRPPAGGASARLLAVLMRDPYAPEEELALR